MGAQQFITVDEQQVQFEIWREGQKAYERERGKLAAEVQAMYERSNVREMITEKKKAVWDEVVITSDGKVEVITRNLSTNIFPRKFTNIRSPELILIVRINNPTDFLYLFRCQIADMEEYQKEVVIDPERIITGNYLLRKFASIGGQIYARSPQNKSFACQLLAALLRKKTRKFIFLRIMAGWNYQMANSVMYMKERQHGKNI